MGFSLCSQVEGQPCPISLMERGTHPRLPPPTSPVKGETGARGRFFIGGEKLQCFLSGQPQGQLARD